MHLKTVKRSSGLVVNPAQSIIQSRTFSVQTGSSRNKSDMTVIMSIQSISFVLLRNDSYLVYFRHNSLCFHFDNHALKLVHLLANKMTHTRVYNIIFLLSLLPSRLIVYHAFLLIHLKAIFLYSVHLSMFLLPI